MNIFESFPSNPDEVILKNLSIRENTMSRINALVEASFSSKQNRFIVHKHLADRAGLHYDLRLEKDGVLISWATRKLDDLVNNKIQKIMLFRQPDHDMDWIDWKGKIESGYGKGRVDIWDKGTYTTHRWTDKLITVTFNGKTLKGDYSFVRYKNEWLFFKKSK